MNNNLTNKFQEYCMLIKTLPTRPPDKELLYLYGMYKQATVGDCIKEEPVTLNLKDRSKWLSWKNNKGMSSSVAMAFYISKIDEIFSGI